MMVMKIKNRNTFKQFVLFIIIFGIGLQLVQVVGAGIIVDIKAELGDLADGRFVAQSEDDSSTGYEPFCDTLFQAPPGNYSKLYASIGGNELVIDCWNSTTTTRTIILKYETVPAGQTGTIALSWTFSDTTNFDATIGYCSTDSSCNSPTLTRNMESSSSLTTDSILTDSPRYFLLTVTYDPPDCDNDGTCESGETCSNCAHDCGSCSPPPAGGGGATITQKTSLKIELPKPLALEEPGPVEFNITLENDGSVNFKDVSLIGQVIQNSKALNTPVIFDKSSFSILEKGKEETINVKTRIDSEEISVYEIVINASAGDPSYKTQAKIYLTFIGKDGRGIVKIVAFTEGFINENAPCLELKSMIDDAKKELEKGNAKEGLEKAQQALEACKKLVEGPKKPIFSFFGQNKLVIYLAAAIILAILFGIGFNVYKIWRFRKARFFKPKKHD